jgi:hypothetical protein
VQIVGFMICISRTITRYRNENNLEHCYKTHPNEIMRPENVLQQWDGKRMELRMISWIYIKMYQQLQEALTIRCYNVFELLGSHSGKYKNHGLPGCHDIVSHTRRHVTWRRQSCKTYSSPNSSSVDRYFTLLWSINATSHTNDVLCCRKYADAWWWQWTFCCSL